MNPLGYAPLSSGETGVSNAGKHGGGDLVRVVDYTYLCSPRPIFLHLRGHYFECFLHETRAKSVGEGECNQRVGR